MPLPGRLQARPRTPAPAGPAPRGIISLGLRPERDAVLYVPPSYEPGRPAPLAVMLHGSGGHAQHGLELVQHMADEAGLIVLAPTSHDYTWDVIMGSYGRDVALIDQALEHVFSHYAVDTQRLAIGGFSDGASYALSLGIDNGDLWTHVVAFSPGFMAASAQSGYPRVFISHGTNDAVLPLARCSRRIVPRLRQAGYDLDYHEFQGGHDIPPEIRQAALAWLLESSGSS